MPTICIRRTEGAEDRASAGDPTMAGQLARAAMPNIMGIKRYVFAEEKICQLQGLFSFNYISSIDEIKAEQLPRNCLRNGGKFPGPITLDKSHVPPWKLFNLKKVLQRLYTCILSYYVVKQVWPIS